MSKRAGSDICARFGRAVRRRREEIDVSQEKLAARALLNRTYIGDIERGRRNVALRNIAKLCDALDISLAKFVTDYMGER